MSGFSRDEGHIEQAFIPDKGHTLYPINSADAQVEEAMALVKERNKQEQLVDPLVKYMTKMDEMNVPTAIAFLDGQSEFERERYLRAEQKGQARVTILRSYGWAE